MHQSFLHLKKCVVYHKILRAIGCKCEFSQAFLASIYFLQFFSLFFCSFLGLALQSWFAAVVQKLSVLLVWCSCIKLLLWVLLHTITSLSNGVLFGLISLIDLYLHINKIYFLTNLVISFFRREKIDLSMAHKCRNP